MDTIVLAIVLFLLFGLAIFNSHQIAWLTLELHRLQLALDAKDDPQPGGKLPNNLSLEEFAAQERMQHLFDMHRHDEWPWW